MARKSSPPSLPNGKVLRYTTIKARLYPTAEQAELFEKTFGCCRYIWNRMLADQQRFYFETDRHFIPTPAKYKKEAPFLKEVDNQALTQEYNKLAQAFRVFWNNPQFGYPKYKTKRTDRDSFTAYNHDFPSGPTIYTTRDGIRMTKAGIVKAVFPRRPRNGWKLKCITVDKTRSGKYYGYILYEYTTKEPVPVAPTPATTVGLKYSLSHFYVDSDGNQVALPPSWKQSQEKLARLQQRLCRMQPGSRNYQQAVQKYQALHERLADQRRDYIHKQSRRLAQEWDAVCIRADDIKAIAQSTTQGRAFESGFGTFRECLRYKLQQQGKSLLLIDRYFPSTRTCSSCGYLSPEPVDYRRKTWVCPECGAVLQREVNAAVNIKEQGLRQANLASPR